MPEIKRSRDGQPPGPALTGATEPNHGQGTRDANPDLTPLALLQSPPSLEAFVNQAAAPRPSRSRGGTRS